jgi:hypothetical protein
MSNYISVGRVSRMPVGRIKESFMSPGDIQTDCENQKAAVNPASRLPPPASYLQRGIEAGEPVLRIFMPP